MTPEEKARVKIDRWFEDAGWQVVNRDEFEPTMSAVAVREGLLKGNLEADYLMFINGKVCGVLEAKREEVNVESDMVSEQVSTYAKSVPDCYQTWQKPNTNLMARLSYSKIFSRQTRNGMKSTVSILQRRL